MNVTIKVHDRDYETVLITIPGRNRVCPRCQGTGTIMNPSIDGNGISSEDFAEDPDFEEAYRSGVYDVAYPECRGLRVVAVLDVGAYVA